MDIKVVCDNKKARHDYNLEDRFEAGLALLGTEVKSMREGRANLKDSYCRIKDGEAFLYGFHISAYGPARDNHDPERTRKLLLHKREVRRLMGQTQERGYSLIPLKAYFKEGKAKVELALAKGKRLYDKRQAMKKRDMKLEVERAIKSRK